MEEEKLRLIYNNNTDIRKDRYNVNGVVSHERLMSEDKFVEIVSNLLKDKETSEKTALNISGIICRMGTRYYGTPDTIEIR